tara:strand:- start:170 stop:1252 length:1083 start_codon:yes stop_codon:yes gene_type:complete
MARSFKNLLGDDSVSTRTLLHEAIPVTGTIASGTYGYSNGNEPNIKTFTHGMFQSVYDYPYLSSSANHIFDITYGCSSAVSSSSNSQNAKKLNIYNQMAQVLMGYDATGSIRKFDSDGTLDNNITGQMDHCFFINFSRLLSKDEVKKNTFRLQLATSGTITAAGTGRSNPKTIGDYLSANQFRTSPAGDYGLLFTGSTAVSGEETQSVGLVFYQAGVAVLTSSIFLQQFGFPGHVQTGGDATPAANKGIQAAQTGSTINQLANGFRHQLMDIDFNNTIELNSRIYFCRVNHNEFNYSANPTYVTGSKIRVKNNVNDLPVSYITTVGLYSPDNELMAVAKLSEPIRKDPNTELTLRVRLDY